MILLTLTKSFYFQIPLRITFEIDFGTINPSIYPRVDIEVSEIMINNLLGECVMTVGAHCSVHLQLTVNYFY